MFLVQTWLVLNATGNSTAGLPLDRAVCNATREGYNWEACHEAACRRSKVLLLNEASQDWIEVDVARSCKEKFYVYGIDEFEFFYPEFKDCYLSTYAAVVEATAIKHTPCRTKSIEEANFIMIPPYLAHECHWPAYGREYCFGDANMYRKGKRCGADAVKTAVKIHKETTKPVLIIDHQPGAYPYRLGPAAYSAEGVIFAKGTTKKTRYRANVDVSMPLAPPVRCSQTPQEAYDEPLRKKQMFVSFKGRLNTPLRERVRDLVHNGNDSVVVDTGDAAFDFDALMYGSRFNLVLPGKTDATARFSEAVCSGGVPVIVSKHWVPPFDEFLPFKTYGVYVTEGSVDTLLNVLRGLKEDAVQELRAKAEAACKGLFMTTEIQARALFQKLLARKGTAVGNPTATEGRNSTM